MRDKNPGYCIDKYTPNDIADMTLSSDYKTRVKGEYLELLNRITKLHRMLVKYQAGKLDFTPDTPIRILQAQLDAMFNYKHWLDVRCEIEDIKIFD